ncbi:MAG: O-antigen ligase family protein [Deltaproteobacteria bacterium]|nr:MAG: O-antigen ligase family protein [Deltaproteobacteria bacterium]
MKRTPPMPAGPPLQGPTETGSRIPVQWALLVGLLCLFTIAAVVVSNGNPAVALAPSLIAVLVGVIWVLPLRVPMLTLLALSWTLEIAGDAFASNLVQTPLRVVGTLLFAKLNLSIPVDALVVSGFDLLLLLFGVVIVYRHSTRSRIDRIGWVEAPRPIWQFAVLALVAIAWMTIFGMARGGSFRFALWQITKHLYLPLVYLLMAEALRGPADAVVVGRVVLGAGIFRSVEAMILRRMFPSTDLFPHAVTHHDSVLFATCVAILLAMLLERPTRRALRICALLLPIFLGGMIANHRRLVWTELAAVAAFFFVITPLGRFKRFVLRSLVVSIVPLLIYGAVGWNSQQRLFGPVRMFRSLFDANVDSSTRWRDFENYDLVATFSKSPLLGSGFGHPFIEELKLPDITKDYELEPYIPHNSVLGLWAFGGLVGFALLWAIYPVGMFFTVRAYRSSRTRIERITALGAAAVQICYVMQGYGDLGFGTWGPVFTVATAYALVGKICVANGAWPARFSRARVGDPPRVQDPAGIPPPATLPFPRARPRTYEG